MNLRTGGPGMWRQTHYAGDRSEVLIEHEQVGWTAYEFELPGICLWPSLVSEMCTKGISNCLSSLRLEVYDCCPLGAWSFWYHLHVTLIFTMTLHTRPSLFHQTTLRYGKLPWDEANMPVLWLQDMHWSIRILVSLCGGKWTCRWVLMLLFAP